MRPVVKEWLGRRHVFRLPLAGLFAIEDETGRPAWDALHALTTGTARVEQIESVLFHGLVGGGASLADAAVVLDDTRNTAGLLRAAMALCAAVLAASLDVPKASGGEGEPFSRTSAYRAAFAMGLKPADVDSMSLREFLATVTAFTSKSGGLSEAEKDELWEWLQGKG